MRLAGGLLPARQYTPAHFKYTPVPSKTQGELISNDFRDRLVREGHAQPMQDVAGENEKRTAEAAGLDDANLDGGGAAREQGRSRRYKRSESSCDVVVVPFTQTDSKKSPPSSNEPPGSGASSSPRSSE